MKTLLTAAALLLLAAPSLRAQNRAFNDFTTPRIATVRVLALSTSAHQNYAGNQDVYMADLDFGKGEHEFAKLVDIYPEYAFPIRRSLLADRALFRIELVRTTGCDMRGAQLFLPPDARVYDASVPDTLRADADQVIPCYRTQHRSIRLAKKKEQ